MEDFTGKDLIIDVDVPHHVVALPADSLNMTPAVSAKIFSSHIFRRVAVCDMASFKTAESVMLENIFRFPYYSHNTVRVAI